MSRKYVSVTMIKKNKYKICNIYIYIKLSEIKYYRYSPFDINSLI